MSRSRWSGSKTSSFAPIAALVAALALGACQGPPGKQGDLGPAGPQGPAGAAGVDHGLIAGTLTVAGSTTPAAGVSVTADPGGATATTDSSGSFSLSLPIGSYTITFGADANDGFEKLIVQNVVVTAGFSTDVSKALTPTNPLVVDVGPVQYQVGFGTTVQLQATVTGAPAGATPTYSWTQVAGPTAALSDAAIANPTFTTGKLADVIGTSATDIPESIRHEVLPIASQQVTQLAYKYKVTVTAGGFTKTGTAEVRPISWSTQNATSPVGQRIVLGAPVQASYAWSIQSAPPGSSAALDYAGDRYVSFVPDLEGVYLVAEAGRATPLRIVASRYQGTGMYSAAGTPEPTTCTASCHYSSGTIAKFQPIVDAWKNSGHAHHFENGVNGVLGTGYSASCIRCHTTGYDPAVNNGGWDDAATQNAYVFPSTVGTGKWDAVPWQVKNRSNINCENCHGPAAQHVASFDKTMVSKPYSARVCMTCHYDGTHHDRGYLWTKSPHSDVAFARSKGLDASGAPNGHCGRCHTAQGFKLYANNLKQGIYGNLTGISGLYDASNVEPVTCQACHDPHTLEVRLEDAIPMLPAGFGVSGVGKGAVCMACHNTRNGAHGDAITPSSLSAPHTPSQTDMLMGKNAYFISGVNVSAHASAVNTCVTCHVDAAVEGVAGLPDTYHMGGTNHTFAVNETVCANCHTANVTGTALQESIEAGIGDLAAAIGKKAYALLGAEIAAGGRFTVVAYDEATDLYSKSGMDVAVTSAEWPADSSSFSPLPEIHGQMSQCWTLKAPVTVTWSNNTTTSVTRLCYQIKDTKRADGTHVFTNDASPAVPTMTGAPGLISKAEWNYYLVHGDGSRGIHNPTFIKAILNNSVAQLSAP